MAEVVIRDQADGDIEAIVGSEAEARDYIARYPEKQLAIGAMLSEEGLWNG